MPLLTKKSASNIAPTQLAMPLESPPTTTKKPVAPSTSPTGYSGSVRPTPPRRLGSTISDSEKFAPILRRLQAAKQVVYDAEASGLDWRKNHIVGHTIAFGPAPADSHYLPVRHGGGGNLCAHPAPTSAFNWDGELHPIEADLIKALDRQDLTIVGHHLDYDLKMLCQLGFELNAKCIDTQINAALLDEYKRSYRLEVCAHDAGVEAKKVEEITTYIRSKFADVKSEKDAMGEFWRLAGDDLTSVSYATGDGTSTWQLNNWQLPQLGAQELDRVWGIECRLIPVLVRMSLVGVRVDPERFTQTRIDIKQKITELEAKFPEHFNVRSPKDVQWWMEQHGVTDWPMTAPSLKFPNGQPLLNKEWLEKSDAGQDITAVRELATLRDSFFGPLQEKHIYNDRVHTNFNQMKHD